MQTAGRTAEAPAAPPCQSSGHPPSCGTRCQRCKLPPFSDWAWRGRCRYSEWRPHPPIPPKPECRCTSAKRLQPPKWSCLRQSHCPSRFLWEHASRQAGAHATATAVRQKSGKPGRPPDRRTESQNPSRKPPRRHRRVQSSEADFVRFPAPETLPPQHWQCPALSGLLHRNTSSAPPAWRAFPCRPQRQCRCR